jgi:hypothetical protein
VSPSLSGEGEGGYRGGQLEEISVWGNEVAEGMLLEATVGLYKLNPDDS